MVFNTIKFRIIMLSVSMLCILSVLLAFFAYMNFKNDEGLMIQSCNNKISSFVENINKEITQFENNAKDLALMGELYYKSNKSDNISKYIVEKVFKYNNSSLGGGIWFEPYTVNKNKKLNCAYSYKDKDGKIVYDEDFESENYNYLNQSWYKEIKSKLIKNRNIAWSYPYYENQGSKSLMTTVGAGIYDNNKLVGLSTVDWKINSIIKTVLKMKPTQNSFLLFADKYNDYIIVSTDYNLSGKDLIGKSLKEVPWYNQNASEISVLKYNNEEYLSYNKLLENGMMLIVNVPKEELYKSIVNHMLLTVLLFMLVSVLITEITYTLLKRNINKPIENLTMIANEIGKGNFDAQFRFDNPDEFENLAKTFLKMSSDIKDYISNLNAITKEKERMEAELYIARAIQYSVLPSIFPPYPDRDEFEIYATMDTAKEVGGDFYDFFFIDDKNFVFLVADVSGKGIPAALFMMTVKTLIKNLAQLGYTKENLMTKVNEQICENNQQGFFVTLFIGVINLETGETNFVNCGHNPPLIKRKNGEFEYLKIEPNLVLGAVSGIDYVGNVTTLNPGDIVYIYTDGITEAFNSENELYGENRLLNCLNEINSNEDNCNLKDIVKNVKANVKTYATGTEQSDDMTMLMFKYNGSGLDVRVPKLYHEQATVENYKKFNSWLVENCKSYNIEAALVSKIELVTEELYTNIVSYAYGDSKGYIDVLMFKKGSNLVIKIIDMGKTFNPLQNCEPDLNAPAEDRAIGGLGIYMVKQMTEKIVYEYLDEKNILTLNFKL